MEAEKKPDGRRPLPTVTGNLPSPPHSPNHAFFHAGRERSWCDKKSAYNSTIRCKPDSSDQIN
ncbi:hypothetical protein AKJ16_DCAP23874 [Drosera capensis]